MRQPRNMAGIVLRIALAGALTVVGTLRGRDTHAASAATVDAVVVNAGTVSQTLAPTFFGINYVGFWDSAQGSAASANALAQTPIKAVRFAGGAPADWYDWQDPYYQGWSSTSPLDLWHYAQHFGGRALFQTNYQGNLPNPPGQSYAVNSPQNAAAWVSYDKAQGIQADMEVGNEEDINMQSANDPNFQPYINAFNAQAQAMHAADPSVKVIGPAGTNEWYWWGLNSLGMFLQQTGNRTGSGQVDGVSLHYYRGGGWSDTYNVAQQWAASGGPWQFIQNTIQSNDTRPLPVSITEWNLGDSDSGTGFNQTLGHSLVTADMIGAFAQSGVAQEDYFDLHAANSYGLLYGTGESRPVDSPTPTYYATALWGKMGTHMLPLTQSADPSSMVSAYAARKDDGSVQVMAINKTAQTQPLQVSYQGFNPQGGTLNVYDLTGAAGNLSDLDANYNGVSMPSPQQPLPGAHTSQTVPSNTLTYTLPAYSIVVLDVMPGAAGGATATATPSGTSAPSATPAPATSTPAPATSTPAPLSVSVTSASAAPSTVAPGGTVNLSATIVTNAALADALVDFEVYDSTGAKVYQSYQSPASFAAATPQTFHAAWVVPSGQAAGPYTLKIGVFSSTWSTLYAWNDNAATFTVGAASATNTPTNTAVPPTSTPLPPTVTKTPVPLTNTPTHTPVPPTNTPTSSATNTPVPPTSTATVSPVTPVVTFDKVAESAVSIRPGQTEHFTATLTINSSLSNELVDFEVYNAAGGKVWQTWRSPLSFNAYKPRTVTAAFRTASTLPAGTYTLKVGVFTSTWSSQAWNNSAAAFSVSSAALTPRLALAGSREPSARGRGHWMPGTHDHGRHVSTHGRVHNTATRRHPDKKHPR